MQKTTHKIQQQKLYSTQEDSDKNKKPYIYKPKPGSRKSVMVPKSGEAKSGCLVAKRQGEKVREEGEFVENYAVVLPHHLCEDLVVLVAGDTALVDLFRDRILLSRDVCVDHVPDQVKVDGLAGLEVQVDASDLQALANDV